MVVSSQANAKEIEALQDKNATMAEKMEKLSLEVTVVVTEKLTLKKELNRVDALYNKVQKDFKEQRVNFDLLVDEVSTVNTQNAEYRGLILENEEKLGQIAQEIQDLQKHIDLKNKALVRQTEETRVYQKQIDKLLEELRDKSDSESFDDEKEKLLNVEKALEADRLKERLKNLKIEVAQKDEELKSNLQRLNNSLKFSRGANVNLKNDYDSLQNKFDKHMKATNNLNLDLK